MTATVHACQDRAATANTVLPGVAMIAVTFGLARYGYGLLLPEMQSDLAVSAGTAGLISSGAYLAYLVANPPTPRRQEILAAHRCTATPVRD